MSRVADEKGFEGLMVWQRAYKIKLDIHAK
jgi:hypothetical protein